MCLFNASSTESNGNTNMMLLGFFCPIWRKLTIRIKLSLFNFIWCFHWPKLSNPSHSIQVRRLSHQLTQFACLWTVGGCGSTPREPTKTLAETYKLHTDRNLAWHCVTTILTKWIELLYILSLATAEEPTGYTSPPCWEWPIPSALPSSQ